MAKIITLTINGKTVSVPEGTTVVDAAKKVGVTIPVFCYHPKMEPVGMCRVCMVEIGRPVIDRASGQPVLDENGKPKVQFGPKLETSCTTPVSDGMLVLTDSPRARANQQEVVELLLTSHPLDCPVCDKGGECPLQNLTMAFGSPVSRFLYDEKQHAAKHVPLGELIYLDRERCIQCARCIRFQDDIAGEPVIGFYNRGRATDIVTFSEPGFDSIFSGNTTDICPVGALTTADFRFGARPWEMKSAASVCAQCPVGCNVTYNVRREASSGGGYVIKRMMPRQNEQVNEIWICDKGRFAGYHFTESDARLKEAFTKQAGGLTPAPLQTALTLAAEQLAAARSGAVILAGGRLSNEDLFNLKKLADGLGAEALLYTPVGGGEQTAAYGLTPGSDLGELGAGDVIVVAAADIHDEAPLWYLRLKAAAKRGATLIVAAARRTKLEEYASFVVRYAYGDEVETIQALSEKEKIGQAIKEARNLVVFYGADGLGVTGSAALAEACAGLVKPRAGQPNNGLVGVWNAANTQGAYELGFKPALDLKALIKGKVLYSVGVDLVADDPAYIEILKQAKYSIIQDVLLTETARVADVVLPVLAYTEREGTFTSAERRVQRYFPALPVGPGLKPDFALTAELGKLMTLELESRAASLVLDEIAAGVQSFAALSYASLAEVNEQYPIVGRSDLYYGGTTYGNTQGLGVQLGVSSLTPAPSPAGEQHKVRPVENEYMAVPVTKVYDLGTTMRAAGSLRERTGGPAVALNPLTAGKLGIHDGDQVKVNLNSFEGVATARFEESISTGVVLVYRSFGIPMDGPAKITLSVLEKA